MKVESKCDKCNDYTNLLFPLVLEGDDKYFCKRCFNFYLEE